MTLVAQKGKADEKAAVDIGRESLRPSRTLRGAGLCRSVALSCGRWRTSELLRRLLASVGQSCRRRLLDLALSTSALPEWRSPGGIGS